jgi:hypothetical protein
VGGRLRWSDPGTPRTDLPGQSVALQHLAGMDTDDSRLAISANGCSDIIDPAPAGNDAAPFGLPPSAIS